MSCAAQRCAAARARAALDSILSLVAAYQQHSLHRFPRKQGCSSVDQNRQASSLLAASQPLSAGANS